METWVWLIIGLAVGIGVGAVGALLIRKNTGSQRSIADLKKENEQFREEVSGHFVETARLINRMTDSYKDVFDHLSRGAETLVDDKSLRERMPLVSGREVRLKHLGTQAGSGAPADDSSSGIEKPPSGRSGQNSSVADSSVPVPPVPRPSSAAKDGATVGTKPSGPVDKGSSDEKSADKNPSDSKPSDEKSSGSKPGSAPGEPTDPLKSAGTRANDQAGTAGDGDRSGSSGMAKDTSSSSTPKPASGPSGSKSGDR